MRISDWSSDVGSSDLVFETLVSRHCATMRDAKGMMANELERTTAADPAAPLATPTEDGLPRRWADFATLGEALDYAATGARGFNFHDPRGALLRAYPFAEMRRDALDCAYRLIRSEEHTSE